VSGDERVSGLSPQVFRHLLVFVTVAVTLKTRGEPRRILLLAKKRRRSGRVTTTTDVVRSDATNSIMRRLQALDAGNRARTPWLVG
jgi:hypothetical protein